MTETEKLVPKRRFKEFINSSAWEQLKLSEIATMHARIGWQNLRTSEFLDSGEYMLITGTDFEDGAINYSTCHYIEKRRYDQDTHIQIDNGSILITKDGTLGKVAYVQDLTMPATLNAGVFNIKIKDERAVDRKYLFQYLKAPYLMDYVEKKATGGTIKHLNQNILVDFPVVLPGKAEQVRIGDYLSHIDHLITLHQHKVKKIKALKSAYLSEMFPAKGECKPKRRFAGFTEDWEQCKVGELACDTYGGGTPATSKEDFWNGSIPWIQSSDLNEHQVFGVVPKKYISYLAVMNSATKVVPENSIAVITRVGVGKLAIMPFSYTTSQDFLSLSKLKIDVVFGAYLLYKKLQSEFNSVQGTSIKGMTKGDLLAKIVYVPEPKEQKAIGRFFEKIDYLITLHQQELEKLQNIKKAFLNEMFI